MVDGDKSLVVADEKIIDVAEKSMVDIVPLYYDMKKAKPEKITKENIYNGLCAAFTGGNIGIYSNNISKIWNSDIFVNGNESERKEAVDAVKLLCMENNFVIDFAKTLYKPTVPNDNIKSTLTQFTSQKLPHFFKYAKDKTNNQVVGLNSSFVNKLYNLIPNPRISTRHLGLVNVDVNVLLSNKKIRVDMDVVDRFKRMCQEYNLYDIGIYDDTHILRMYHVQMIKAKMRDLKYTDSQVSDILTKYFYEHGSRHKTMLWILYGENIYANILKNLKTKVCRCEACFNWFTTLSSEDKLCHECYEKTHKRARLRT